MLNQLSGNHFLRMVMEGLDLTFGPCLKVRLQLLTKKGLYLLYSYIFRYFQFSSITPKLLLLECAAIYWKSWAQNIVEGTDFTFDPSL